MKISKEDIATIIRIIRDICIALLAAFSGTMIVSSCGVTTRAYVHNNADANTSMSIVVTSPQNYTTTLSPSVDSTSVKIH